MSVIILEEHSSPDQVLRLLVTRSDDGDTSVGFDGGRWHTHGDILAALTGLGEPDAVRRLVEQVLADLQVIAVERKKGRIQDIWLTDDPDRELQWQTGDEVVELRLWSGPRPEPDSGSP